MLIKKVVKFDRDEVNSAEVMKDIKHSVCEYLMNQDCGGCPFENFCNEMDDLLNNIIDDEMLSVED
jgi:predicted nucleotide-binding protein (sugar kinase/HSP70/actin superfamily)